MPQMIAETALALETVGRPQLAKILRQHGDTELDNYAKSLWSPFVQFPEIEPELLAALNSEYSRLEAGDVQIQGWLWSPGGPHSEKSSQSANDCSGALQIGPPWSGSMTAICQGVGRKLCILSGAPRGQPAETDHG